MTVFCLCCGICKYDLLRNAPFLFCIPLFFIIKDVGGAFFVQKLVTMCCIMVFDASLYILYVVHFYVLWLSWPYCRGAFAEKKTFLKKKNKKNHIYVLLFQILLSLCIVNFNN